MPGAYLSELRVKAFKSVGAEWLEVSLDRGLACLVGKNGSGKSSLLDAICFATACASSVLGVQRLADLQNSDCDAVCEAQLAISQGSSVTWISASLTPDGTRAHKIGGKLKTGKDVKEFLRDKNINLDSVCSVIKQAQVTALADTNCPTKLAQVVADVSGLSHWNREAAVAISELKRTREAIVSINANVSSLEAAVAADQVKCAALVKLEEQNARLADANLAVLHARLAAKESELAAEAGAHPDPSSSSEIEELSHAIAGKEEQVSVLEERLAATRELARAAAEAESACAAASMEANLSASALQEHQATVQKLQAAMESAGWDDQAASSALLREIECQEERLAEATALAEAAKCTALKLQDYVAAALDDLARLEREHQKHAAPSAVDALDIIAGNKLRVAIVQTTEQAKALLDWLAATAQKRQCRIWPVNMLSVSADQTARQRAAQSHFPAGDVILPLDLLESEPAMQPVLARAFSMLIAHTDEVAAALASRYRLASVTLGGRVSRLGSLQGGWRGSSLSTGRHMMARKHKYDLLQADCTLLDAHLQNLRRAESELVAKSSDDQAKAEELEEAAERLRERAADQGTAEEAQTRLERAQEALYQDQQALRALQAEAAMRSAEQAHQYEVAAQLRAHVASFKENVADVQRRITAARDAEGGAQRVSKQAAHAAEALAADAPELAPVLHRAALPASSQELAALAAQIQKLQAARLKLKVQRDQNSAKELPLAVQRAFKERQETLRTVRERAATLCSAVEILDAGLAASQAQVVWANERAFVAIRSQFKALVEGLLPAHEVDLIKTSDTAAKGVQFCVASSAAAGGSRRDPLGQTALGQLSGGERTLVSLALMLAAAYAGAGNRLLILDEVDAALDETNQGRVAALLRQLASGSGTAACQVLAVTHNAAFQACGRLVQVYKNASGTHVKAAADAALEPAASSKRVKAA
ncbi:hypothetical protein WJX81_004731 [Elliptochloris bilobata]|uniref:Structural maintenance of chromosomes protein n=1 Tax=Elliptochloris bilobata TaxID=381761 RepID=A0AAW1SDX0_9CHLO